MIPFGRSTPSPWHCTLVCINNVIESNSKYNPFKWHVIDLQEIEFPQSTIMIFSIFINVRGCLSDLH